MSGVSLKDHEKEDGSIDWDSYHRAQVASGDKCRNCGQHILGIGDILFGRDRRGPRDCGSCQQLQSKRDEAVEHKQKIRCPTCLSTFDPWDPDGAACYPVQMEDHSREVWCHSCDSNFSVTIKVHYTFVSPPEGKANYDPDEDDWDEEPDDRPPA